MSEVINQILDVAETCEQNNDLKTASSLEKIANSFLKITVAQYVGIQGYAVRNSRCFGNCYRQKRASKPDMPAQLVWQECHKEYVESINNDGSKWDKYAGNNGRFVIASIADTNLESFVREYKLAFAKTIDEQVANGSTYGYAIQHADSNFAQKMNDELQLQIQRLVRLANKQSDSDLANQIHNVAVNMHKEAQGFMGLLGRGVEGLGNLLSGGGQKLQGMGGNLIGGAVSKSIGGFVQNLDAQIKQLVTLNNKIRTDMNNLITNYAKELQAKTPKNPQVQAKVKSAIDQLSVLQKETNINNIVKVVWPKVKASLQQIQAGTATAPVAGTAPASVTPAGAPQATSPGGGRIANTDDQQIKIS